MKRIIRTCIGLLATAAIVAVTACNTAIEAQKDKAAVTAAAAKLAITYTAGDTAQTVTQNLTLPTTVDGITVTWTSSNPAVIGIDGKVTRLDADTQVTLTATLTKNAATNTKSFLVTIKGIVAEWVAEQLNKAAVSPTGITKIDYHITLIGENVTWTSSNPAIINVVGKNSGTYAVQAPSQTAHITLTAQAQKAGITKTKDFFVTVYPPSYNLEALAHLNKLTIPTEAEDDFDLPQTIEGVPSASITWTTNNHNAIGISSSKARITRNLRDVTARLTAKLYDNGATAEKDFPVTVKKITEIKRVSTSHYGNGETHTITETYTFTDNTITKERIDKNDVSGSEQKDGSRYMFSNLNTSAQTFTAHQTHMQLSDGRWIELGSAEHWQFLQQEQEGILKDYQAYRKLAEKASISLQDIREALTESGAPPLADDKEAFERTLKDEPEAGDYEHFITLSPAEQTRIIKHRLARFQKELAVGIGATETASWDEIFNTIRRDFEADNQRFITQAQTPAVYRYDMGRESFYTKALYDNTKPWYQQRGSYSYSSSGSDNTRVWLSVSSLQYQDQNGNKSYHGKLNADGTQFTGQLRGDHNQTITVSITDLKNGKISIIMEGKTYELSFTGDSLL